MNQPNIEARETQNETPSFETSLKELEKIVQQLEKGDQPIENQLKSFEKGVALSRKCMSQLEEVEKRVEILLQNGGSLETKPFETEAP